MILVLGTKFFSHEPKRTSAAALKKKKKNTLNDFLKT